MLSFLRHFLPTGKLREESCEGITFDLFPKTQPVSPDSDQSRRLVVQGNGQLADRLVPSLNPFTAAGYDAFVFDYRGFGASEGKRRMKAILSDYGEIVRELNGRDYRHRALYGLSFGGVVLLNAVTKDDYDSLVIEASHGDISAFECPMEWSPPRRLPEDCNDVLLMASDADPVIDAEKMAPLIAKGGQRGATVVIHSSPYHPFMAEPGPAQEQRLETVLEFLARERSDNEQ